MKLLVFLLMFLMVSDVARRANEAYERGDYAAAEAAYLEAIRANPDDHRLHFNLGNALARQGKFSEAITAYERFREMAPDHQSRALADYNIGNIYGMQEKWDRAAEQFRSALRQNPADSDAKHNYEVANRNLQEQEQDPDSGNQQNDDQNEGNDQDQQDGQQSDGSGQQDEQEDQQQQQNQQGNEQEQRERPRPESNMTQEEADQVLNALENMEKDLLKDYHKKQIPSNTRHAKNW